MKAAEEKNNVTRRGAAGRAVSREKVARGRRAGNKRLGALGASCVFFVFFIEIERVLTGNPQIMTLTNYPPVSPYIVFLCLYNIGLL